MKVTVVDRAYISRAWGNGYRSILEALRTVEIANTCPRCGGPRGEPQLQRMCEDGEWYSASIWQNPCSHIDMYPDVLAEAARHTPTYTRQLPDGRYEFGRIIYAHDRRKDRLQPAGVAFTFEEADAERRKLLSA